MRKMLLVWAAAIAMAMPVCQAQETHPLSFNIGSSGYICGINANYCIGIPLAETTPSGVTSGTLFYDTSGLADFVTFSGGFSSLGTAQGVGNKTNFVGIDDTGRTYYVTLNLVFWPYRGCVTGRVSRCSTYYRVSPESTIFISYN